MISYDEFKAGVERALEQKDGVVYFKIGKTPNDKDVAIVIGWDDACGLDEDMEANYIENHYILSAKVAYNCDDLQCDYGWDWYMPEIKETNDVYDTGCYLSKDDSGLKKDFAYLVDIAENVLAGYKKGEFI